MLRSTTWCSHCRLSDAPDAALMRRTASILCRTFHICIYMIPHITVVQHSSYMIRCVCRARQVPLRRLIVRLDKSHHSALHVSAISSFTCTASVCESQSYGGFQCYCILHDLCALPQCGGHSARHALAGGHCCTVMV
jgi:hypothetical protein